jgi:hypothetical protein
MPRVFISYRRADSVTITGRIHDHLVHAFGQANIFKDVDDIPLGSDFRQVLDHEVSTCDVLLVIVGPQWVNAADEQNQPRLANPDDFVRIEVAAGLTRPEVLVIPVLVRGASMPTSLDLPDDLRDLAYRNAAIVRDDPDFSRDMQRLIAKIEAFKPTEAPAPTPVAQPSAPQQPPVATSAAPSSPPPAVSSKPDAGSPSTPPLLTIGIAAAVVIALVIVGVLVLNGRGIEPTSERVLTCGESLRSIIAEADDFISWRFEMEENGTTDLLLAHSGSDAEGRFLEPRLTLYRPNGQVIESVMAYEGDDARIAMYLDAGPYVLEAGAADTANENRGVGPFELSLDCLFE